MSQQKFLKKQAIKIGWNTMKKNFWFFVGLILFILAVSYIPALIFNAFDKVELPTIVTVFFFIMAIVFWVIQLVISIGLIHIALKFTNNAKSVFADLFGKANKIVDYFLSTLLYSLIVASGYILLFVLSHFNLISGLADSVGFILVIVFGIIFATRLQFYQYYIVDKDKSPIKALKASWAATNGSVWNLILFWLLMMLINLAGALALGIGLFLTIPTTMIAMAFVYKKLSSTKNV
ncbi:MAG: hypothetical protein AUJ34_01520 [Parcubacteria group bacterium CG1_02_41_12]|nr:MAG: hypothetical protein AUJ34_01520 [Parcubacteria group bacterium CG1_02_41_12]